MATIVTRSGKGSPLTHAEVDANFTNLNTDKLELSGGTMTGNLSFGDNDKAIFGAGSDLQIYHDGFHSNIKESGAGSLLIDATNIYFRNAAGTKDYLDMVDGGAVTIKYNNAAKLATTSTGVDITGTLTSDGLTVDGTTAIPVVIDSNQTDTAIQFKNSGYDDAFIEYNDNNLFFYTDNKRFLSLASNGDISFYEDTGTTAKFFWDASAERLGIGTTSPDVELEVNGGIKLGGSTLALGLQSGYNLNLNTGTDTASATAMIFNTDDTERMRIDSSGRVMIGTTSSSSLFTVQSTGTSTAHIKTTATNGFAQMRFENDAKAYSIGVGSNDQLYFYDNTSSTNRILIDSSGNVGIGTSSPDTELHVEADTPVFRLTNPQSTSSLGLSMGKIEWETRDSSASGVIAHIDVVDSNNFGTTFDMAFATGQSGSAIERMRIDSSGQVGIGTSSPSAALDVLNGSGNGEVAVFSGTDSDRGLSISTFAVGGFGQVGVDLNAQYSSSPTMTLSTGGTEAMRIDSDGNLLVGTTALISPTNSATTGHRIYPTGDILSNVDGNACAYFNRLTSNGDIVEFSKGGSPVGSISTHDTRLAIGSDDTYIMFDSGTSPSIWPSSGSAGTDGIMDIGDASRRFKNLYLSGGVYLGGTGASNKLDDYEEGTWTPTLLGVTGITYQDQIGSYTKIGNFVHLSFQLRATWTASGNSYIGGIPFTSRNNTNDYGTGGFFTIQQPERTTVRASMFIQPNNSSITLYEIDGHTQWALPSATANYLNGNVFYRV